MAVAKLFWAERTCDKPRSWFNRAGDRGDAWAYFYRFEVQRGTEDRQRAALRRAEEADPKREEKWTQVTTSLDHGTVGGCRLTTEQIVRKALCDTKGDGMALRLQTGRPLGVVCVRALRKGCCLAPGGSEAGGSGWKADQGIGGYGTALERLRRPWGLADRQ